MSNELPENENKSALHQASASSSHDAAARQAILKEIRSKWSKFSESELSALKSNADIVTHVSSKYSLDKTQAQADVDSMMAGRQLA